jgi:tRNA 2-selenouridine synthase
MIHAVHDLHLIDALAVFDACAAKNCEAQSVNSNFSQPLLIDVRSESEFAEANIPGSHSLPILNDLERAEIGTLFKQVSPEVARRRGMQIVLPKLLSFFEAFSSFSGGSQKAPSNEKLRDAFELVVSQLWRKSSDESDDSSGAGVNISTATVAVKSASRQLIFYCWRGGARSKSMALLAQALGFKASIICGGHKAFRNHVQEYLSKETYPFELATIYGLTGSGKTQLLQHWLSEGKPIIDLEGLAHHRGSAFGQVGIQTIGRQPDFENNLYWQMRELEHRGEKLVVVEGESRRIGRCSLPDRFMRAMNEGYQIQLRCELEKRVQNILKEYVLPSTNNTALGTDALASLNVIQKRLGGELFQKLVSLLAAQNYETFTRELLVNYYDKMYEKSQAPDGTFDAVITGAADWHLIQDF